MYLDVRMAVDVVDSDVFSQHRNKPASVFAKSKSAELGEYNFLDELYQKHGETAVPVQAGTTPP